MSYSKRNIKYRNIKSYARTSTVLFTLFESFITPRAGEISVRGLIHLLGPLGFSENAIRLVLSRMAKQGLVRNCRRGRISYYSLTGRGSAACAAGRKSVSDMEEKTWDKTWYCVVYTVPERKRHVRDSLRIVLRGLGYGNLGGVWLSPYGFTHILDKHIQRLNAHAYVEMFTARYAGTSDLRMLARSIWDIRGLQKRYGSFIKKYQRVYEDCRSKLLRGICLKPDRCFAERFRVDADYIDIALDDPMLPHDMLGDPWIGSTAKHLTLDVKNLLTGKADEYVSMVMDQEAVRSGRRVTAAKR